MILIKSFTSFPNVVLLETNKFEELILPLALMLLAVTFDNVLFPTTVNVPSFIMF